MNVSEVNQAVNLWAMKKEMTVARNQINQLVQSAAKAPDNWEPQKGTLIDVRL